jgi:hypothetical protein
VRRARLFALRAVYLATALVGTALGVTGLVLWAVADAIGTAAQPDLEREERGD